MNMTPVQIIQMMMMTTTTMPLGAAATTAYKFGVKTCGTWKFLPATLLQELEYGADNTSFLR